MHHEIMFGLLFYRHLDLLVESTDVSWMLVISVLLDQLLPLAAHFLRFFNRRILGFIIRGWNSSNVIGIARWLAVPSNFFVYLVDNLLRGHILFMGSSVSGVLIEPLSVDDDFALFFSS